MKNILVPMDGSEYAQKALEYAMGMAQAIGARITILYVSPYPPSITPEMSLEDPSVSLDSNYLNRIRVMLDEKKEFLETMNIPSQLEISEGDPADVIASFANAQDIDHVVMGSKGIGAGALSRLLLGSVAEKVLHRVNKPITIIR